MADEEQKPDETKVEEPEKPEEVPEEIPDENIGNAYDELAKLFADEEEEEEEVPEEPDIVTQLRNELSELRKEVAGLRDHEFDKTPAGALFQELKKIAPSITKQAAIEIAKHASIDFAKSSGKAPKNPGRTDDQKFVEKVFGCGPIEWSDPEDWSIDYGGGKK